MIDSEDFFFDKEASPFSVLATIWAERFFDRPCSRAWVAKDADKKTAYFEDGLLIYEFGHDISERDAEIFIISILIGLRISRKIFKDPSKYDFISEALSTYQERCTTSRHILEDTLSALKDAEKKIKELEVAVANLRDLAIPRNLGTACETIERFLHR